MQIQQQKNKMDFRGLKGQFALSLFFVFGSFILSSWCEHMDTNIDDDYLLLNNIFSSYKDNKKIILQLDNSNEFLVSTFKEIQNCNLQKNENEQCFELMNEIKKMDAIHFNLLFKNETLSFMISQKHNGKWDKNNVDFPKRLRTTNTRLKKSVIISKPIYTKDKNFAFVYVNNVTNEYVSIFKRENRKWESFKMIFPKIINPKVKLQEK